jgi:hypothetical protein
MTTTHRTTLAALPDPIGSWLRQRLPEELFDLAPDTTAFLSTGETSAPDLRRWGRRRTDVLTLTTVVLAGGGHLLIAVVTPSGRTVLRGPLVGLDTRGGPLVAGVTGVHVNGLVTADAGAATYFVRTGAPDGPALAQHVTDAIRRARTA